MSAKIFVAIAALCLLQSTHALVRRDAQTDPQKKDQLDEIRQRATELANEVSVKFNEAFNNEEFKKNFHNNTENIFNALQDFGQKYGSQLSTVGDNVKSTISDAISKINATITDLREKHPEIEAKSKEFGDDLKAGVQGVISQTDKVIKSLAENTEGVRGDFEKATKEGYSNLVKTLEDLKKRANDAANKQ